MSNDNRSTARPPPGTAEESHLYVHILNEYDYNLAKSVGILLATKTFKNGSILVDYRGEITPSIQVRSDLAIVAVNEFTDLDEILLRTHLMCRGARIIVHNTAPCDIDESSLFDNQVYGLFQQYDYKALYALVEEALQLKNSAKHKTG